MQGFGFMDNAGANQLLLSGQAWQHSEFTQNQFQHHALGETNFFEQVHWPEPSPSVSQPLAASPPGILRASVPGIMFAPLAAPPCWRPHPGGSGQPDDAGGPCAAANDSVVGLGRQAVSSQGTDRRSKDEGTSSRGRSFKAGGDRQHDHGNTSLNGPCYLKMLMPNHIAGALIGKDGSKIGEMLVITRCQVLISDVDAVFPGTADRIVVMSGTMENLTDCIKMALRRLRDASANQRGSMLLAKLAVPQSAVSALIGHKGDKVKQLSDETQCRINMSGRVDGMKERLVSISGEFDSLMKATVEIARRIQGDSHLKEHLALKYSISLPLGVWSGEKAHPADPEVPLIPLEDIEHYTKREVVECLRQAAPREILLKHGLLGIMKNILKSKSIDSLKEALDDTIKVRLSMASETNLVFRQLENMENDPEAEEDKEDHPEVAPLPVGEVRRPQVVQPQLPQPSSHLVPLAPIRRTRSASPQPQLPQPSTHVHSPAPTRRSGADAAAGGSPMVRNEHDPNRGRQPGPEGLSGIDVLSPAPSGHRQRGGSAPSFPQQISLGLERDRAMNLSFSFIAPGAGSPLLDEPEEPSAEADGIDSSGDERPSPRGRDESSKLADEGFKLENERVPQQHNSAPEENAQDVIGRDGETVQSEIPIQPIASSSQASGQEDSEPDPEAQAFDSEDDSVYVLPDKEFGLKLKYMPPGPIAGLCERGLQARSEIFQVWDASVALAGRTTSRLEHKARNIMVGLLKARPDPSSADSSPRGLAEPSIWQQCDDLAEASLSSFVRPQAQPSSPKAPEEPSLASLGVAAAVSGREEQMRRTPLSGASAHPSPWSSQQKRATTRKDAAAESTAPTPGRVCSRIPGLSMLPHRCCTMDPFFMPSCSAPHLSRRRSYDCHADSEDSDA